MYKIWGLVFGLRVLCFKARWFWAKTIELTLLQRPIILHTHKLSMFCPLFLPRHTKKTEERPKEEESTSISYRILRRLALLGLNENHSVKYWLVSIHTYNKRQLIRLVRMTKKCSEWSIALLGNYDGLTDRPTDRTTRT